MTVLAYLLAALVTPIVHALIGIPLMLMTLPLIGKSKSLRFPVALAGATVQSLATFWLFVWTCTEWLEVSASLGMFAVATVGFLLNGMHRLSTRPIKELELGHLVGDIIGIWLAWLMFT